MGGSSRTDANDSPAVTNNNDRKPTLNFEPLSPPRLEVQPCTPRAEVVVPYNFTSSPSTPRLEALRLEGVVARRSLHGSTTSLQSCLKDPLRDEDSGSLHSAGSRVSFSEDVRGSPRPSPRPGGASGNAEPRWVKELGGPSTSETGML